MTEFHTAPSSRFTVLLVTGMVLAGAGAALVTVVPTWLGIALPLVGMGLIVAAVVGRRTRDAAE